MQQQHVEDEKHARLQHPASRRRDRPGRSPCGTQRSAATMGAPPPNGHHRVLCSLARRLWQRCRAWPRRLGAAAAQFAPGARDFKGQWPARIAVRLVFGFRHRRFRRRQAGVVHLLDDSPPR